MGNDGVKKLHSDFAVHQADCGIRSARRFTNKQMGDACEMLVAAELTLAGIPALKVPDNWSHYDVIAQALGRPAQRISVKARMFKGPGPGEIPNPLTYVLCTLIPYSALGTVAAATP